MRRALLLFLALIPAPVLACKCLTTYPVCREVAEATLCLSARWSRSGPHSSILGIGGIRRPRFVDEIERLRRDGSTAAATQLKAIYGNMLGSLTGADKRKLESATTLAEVEAGFKAIVSGGRRAHFKVKTMYRAVKDDDDDKDIEAGTGHARVAYVERNVFRSNFSESSPRAPRRLCT
jgi:hypothetical protein